MRYRKLGNTGLTVSETGFGTIPILQGSVPVLPEYYNLDEEAALAVMGHAFSLGCNLYDTAIVPEYGDAEIKLGKFAARIGRNRI
ncbi:MAG: aldo/keto reductase, partial [Lachnospiraceae bacterium]|nr:aldo/keto reductase [Lachnospiraceae bacterium]